MKRSSDKKSWLHHETPRLASYCCFNSDRSGNRMVACTDRSSTVGPWYDNNSWNQPQRRAFYASTGATGLH
jgi:hypothetical protein